ncbi:hypothetical protein T12_14826 [Trichinella patagoniensis]|uniref:Uncharacterized protein n=1 Tax=Trichinella patagoniensis TaxID=990121 RepID=A0A0V0ZDR4_9BILA|nr:hypothetical protein T12_14826 [Trichinella patagoniensis]
MPKEMNADASGGILLNITIDCNQTIVQLNCIDEIIFIEHLALEQLIANLQMKEEDYEDRCYKLAQHRSLVKGTINKAIRSTKKQMPVSVQTNDSSKV